MTKPSPISSKRSIFQLPRTRRTWEADFKNPRDLPDPRVNRTKDHELIDVLTIAICTLLCAGESFNDMEDFGHAKHAWFKTFLPLRNGIPSHDTFGRVFAKSFAMAGARSVIAEINKEKAAAVFEEIAAAGGCFLDPMCGSGTLPIEAALIAANERSLGSNIVDLRGIAMERLEARLDRLEDTHRTVVAAAYENLAGTNQVHRAVLSLLEATNFDDFLIRLGGDVAAMLKVDSLRLVLESQIGRAHV